MEDRLVHWIDLLRLPLAALGQQKLRTCLTTLGVVFGAFVLAASLSIDEGVQRTIEREANKGDVSRKVTVSPRWRAAETKTANDVKVAGRMAPDRRERIRKVLAQRDQDGRFRREQVSLTPDRLETLSRIAHVRRMIPIVGRHGRRDPGQPARGGERLVRCRRGPGVPQAGRLRPVVRLGRREIGLALGDVRAPDRADRRRGPGPGPRQAPADRDSRPGSMGRASMSCCLIGRKPAAARRSRRRSASSPGRSRGARQT